MDSASIWDIYNTATKLLPLSERMNNRTVRQQSANIQQLKKNTLNNNNSSNNNNNTSTIMNSLNNINNEDIISMDLLTPLTSSPATSITNALKSNHNSNNNNNNNNNNNVNNNNNNSDNDIDNNTNITNNNNTSNNTTDNINNNNNNNNTTSKLTPNSLTESPTSATIITSNDIKGPSSSSTSSSSAFSELNNINNQLNLVPSNIDNNTVSSIDPKTTSLSNSSNHLYSPTNLGMNIGIDMDINMNQNYAFADLLDFKNEMSNDNDNDITMNNLDFDVLRELQQINDSTMLNLNHLNHNMNTNNNNNNNMSMNVSDDKEIKTIKPLEIKIKSETSVSLNNQNIISNNDTKSKSTNNNNNNNNTPNNNMNEIKFEKIKKPSTKSNNIDIISGKNILSSTPQPNELQTQARQSNKNVSSSVPTKIASKQILTCNNCGTTKTPLWRKDPDGNTLCNACGLFLKLHGTMRPLSLKTDVIKKRNSKRQSMSAQGEGYKNLSTLTQNQLKNQLQNNNNNINNITSNNSSQNLPDLIIASQSYQSPKSYSFFPQSVPNSQTLKNNSSMYQNQIQFKSNDRHMNQSSNIPIASKIINITSNNSSTSLSHLSNSNSSLSRSKNVPILPKPSKDSSSPGTPRNSFNVNSSISQPQDIPQFKRRRSKLNLSTSQNSQPSSPSTAVSFSPSSSVAYSPINNITNNQSSSYHSPVNNINPSSPANSLSMFGKSNSRHNSISSASSYNLYQDINTKRGLSSNNIAQLNTYNLTSNLTNGIINLSNNNMNSPNSPGSLPNQSPNGFFNNSNNSSTATTNGNNTINNNNNNTFNNNTNKYPIQREQKISNFSNLSAGINAIRNTSARSSLSKCVANGNSPSSSTTIKKSNKPTPKLQNAELNSTDNSNNTNTNSNNTNTTTNDNGGDETMTDLDWLKFDI